MDTTSGWRAVLPPRQEPVQIVRPVERVGGLFSSGKMWSFPSKDNTTLDDCNNARNGVYRNFPSTKNMPREFSPNEGAVIVARPVNNLISVQECYFQNGDFYTRVEWGTGLWSSWIKR